MKANFIKTIVSILVIVTISNFNYGQTPFITTWETTSVNESITIPTYDGLTYNYTVNWGDGNVTHGHNSDASHTYLNAGTHQISITGTFPRIYFINSDNENDVKIISIDQWGSQQWSSMEGAFFSCDSIEVNSTDQPNLSNVTSLKQMFFGCAKFNQNINSWDVTTITNMKAFLQGATQFNSNLDTWDVSNVTDMGWMFDGTSFNQDISNWDVSNVIDFTAMFQNSPFNQDISSWDVSNAKEIDALFNATPFNQDISSWDVGNVISMSYLFSGTPFNYDISNWDVSNVNYMSGLFNQATLFNQNIGSWDMGNVRGSSYMFRNATSFNQDISGWDMHNLLNGYAMFENAVSFNQDISGWDMSFVFDMRRMFKGATSFNQDISGWDTGNCSRMAEMFSNATSFDQNLGSWNVELVLNMNDMFEGVELSQENYDALLIGWSSQDLMSNINFDGGYSQYCLGEDARQSIIDTYGWTITDGGYGCNLPDCTHMTEPVIGETGVDINTDISWAQVGEATGYKLTIEIDGDYLFENEDVGYVTTYDPGELLCGSTVYVTITPYNDIGDAIDCSQEYFTTEFVTADVGTDVTLCFGDSTQLNAMGGSVYSWSPTTGLDNPNIANPIANPISTTTYTVTVSNENGCTDTDEVVVTVNTQLIAVTESTDETGENYYDGTATVNVTGGTTPYSFQWSNGAITQTIQNLAPGIYWVTVTDTLGCSASDSTVVAAFGCPPISLNTQQQNVTCFGDCNGSLNITNVVNGTAPFTYTWNNDQSTSSIVNLCAGNYNVTVEDANGCVIVGSYNITEPNLLEANATATDETESGQNNGVAIANPTGGKPPYTYAWSTGETTQSIQNLAPGQYYITVTDSKSCTNIDTVTVNAAGCGTLEIVSQQINETCFSSCDGIIAISYVSNSTPPLEFSWSNGSTASILNNLCGGTYVLTVTDANNCVVIDTFVIESQNEIIIQVDTIYNITSNGYGAIFVLTNDNGSYSYSWTGPNNFTSNQLIIINLSVEGCYTLGVTDDNSGCTKDTTICIDDLTGTNDWTTSDLHLYPNPTTGTIYLPQSFPAHSIHSIHTIDALGTFHEMREVGELSFMLPGIPGLYIVLIEMEDGSKHQEKIIVQE